MVQFDLGLDGCVSEFGPISEVFRWVCFSLLRGLTWLDFFVTLVLPTEGGRGEYV